MGNWSPRQRELVRGLILVAIVELIVRVHPCYFVTLELALHCRRMHLYCLLPPEAAVSHCGHTDWGIKSFYKEHVRAFTETVSFASCRETVSSRPDLPELLRGGRRTLVRKGRGLRTNVRVVPAQPDLLDARAMRAGMQLPSWVSDSRHQY